MLKTPITIDVSVIECDENQLMNPEISQMKQIDVQKQELVKSFLHLNDLFAEGVPFESGLKKIYLLKNSPYQFTYAYVPNVQELNEEQQKVYLEQMHKVIYDVWKQLQALGHCNSNAGELVIQNTSKDFQLLSMN